MRHFQSKPPKSKYIVVEDPWPGHDNSRALRPSQAFFNYVGAWLHIALGCAEPYPVKAIYHRSKRDEIVVKLDKRVDITPLLGAHHWRKFTTYQSATSNDTISYIFEFNYKRHGDPAEKVEPVPPPPNRKLPIREPDMYPAPSRTSLIGRASIDLALKLPEERLRAETPPPPEPVVEPPSRLEIKRDSDESRDIKRPFDGILSLPAHPSVKMDPYDAERMHAHVLQSQNARSSSRLPESVVKVESHENESQSQPPAALLQALEKLQQARMKTSRRKEGADAQSEAIEEALRRLHESREPQEGQASDPGLPRMSTTLSEQADELRTAIEELKRATIPSGQPASSNPMSFGSYTEILHFLVGILITGDDPSDTRREGRTIGAQYSPRWVSVQQLLS
ncbi:hypothetical protein K474DRAFT_160253 [Panus rudis PR-1116 ss-1]|nr:hypothetical protein K474DRAFT_160253 [Panus rudis PR-1116 ss-1]